MKLSILIASATISLIPFSMVHAHGKKTDQDNHDAVSEVVREQKPWGIAGNADEVTRTIDVAMLDTMQFEPAKLQIQQGETIRFIARNNGAVLHEFVLGTTQTNDEHAELMVRFPGMEHDEPYMAHVDPAASGEIIWTFNRDGEFDFACLIAGHYQAGMRGTISVMSNS